jgi:hypothetical protein
MNDERVPPTQRDAIAKKLAPYFHSKLKPVPVPPELFAAASASTITEDPSEEEPGSLAARRDEFRRKFFKGFD